MGWNPTEATGWQHMENHMKADVYRLCMVMLGVAALIINIMANHAP
jgi:hypothetical protein